MLVNLFFRTLKEKATGMFPATHPADMRNFLNS